MLNKELAGLFPATSASSTGVVMTQDRRITRVIAQTSTPGSSGPTSWVSATRAAACGPRVLNNLQGPRGLLYDVEPDPITRQMLDLQAAADLRGRRITE